MIRSEAIVAAVIGPLLAIAMVAQAAEDQQSPEQLAEKSAKAWLAKVDGGDYAGSWHAAASFFRKAVTQAQWKQAMVSTRKPLGKALSRKLSAAEFRTSLPGAPDGKYVVLQFATSFEHKRSAVETITPMLDADGKWRVSGYFIK